MIWRVVLWSAWFRTFFSLASQLSPTTLRILCPRNFRLVSRLSPSTFWMLWVPWSAWFHTCCAVVSHCAKDVFWASWDAVKWSLTLCIRGFLRGLFCLACCFCCFLVWFWCATLCFCELDLSYPPHVAGHSFSTLFAWHSRWTAFGRHPWWTPLVDTLDTLPGHSWWAPLLATLTFFLLCCRLLTQRTGILRLVPAVVGNACMYVSVCTRVWLYMHICDA